MPATFSTTPSAIVFLPAAESAGVCFAAARLDAVAGVTSVMWCSCGGWGALPSGIAVPAG